MRAERKEERGEGVAASAFCNSASLAASLAAASLAAHGKTQRNPLSFCSTAPQPPRAAESNTVLILFAGPYARTDGMRTFLEELGFRVELVDNDPVHGDPAHDVTDPAFYGALAKRVADG